MVVMKKSVYEIGLSMEINAKYQQISSLKKDIKKLNNKLDNVIAETENLQKRLNEYKSAEVVL